jgi:hypothetical protein
MTGDDQTLTMPSEPEQIADLIRRLRDAQPKEVEPDPLRSYHAEVSDEPLDHQFAQVAPDLGIVGGLMTIFFRMVGSTYRWMRRRSQS